MNMKAPIVKLPDLPIEHFRCQPRAETLLRTACASNYARVAVTGRAPGPDKHCSGCTIGAVHGSGHVPTHKAPTVKAPVDAGPVELTCELPRAPKSTPPKAEATRTARCEVGGHAFQCAAKGRVPKRCGEHRGYVPPVVSPKAPLEDSLRPSLAEEAERTFLAPEPKRGPGRPPVDTGDDWALLSVRTTKADRARIDAAAVRAGLTTMEWARVALLGAATIVGVR